MVLRGFFSKAYRTYKSAKEDAFNRRNLIYTNVLLSVGISSLGDSIEQTYELSQNDIDRFDPMRTLQMGLSGFTAGLICHHWYNILDRVIVGRTLGMALKKLMLDQFVCTPLVIMSFFATVAIFEENPLENFNQEVAEKFWILYKAEWIVWPPAQLINFYFLPTKYRVLYDNAISLGYDIYTSRIKHSKHLKSHKEEDKNTPHSKDEDSHD